MSDSLQLHGLQHARLPCPLSSPGTCSNSCSLNRWCHPTISSSVIPFSSCLQSLPASGSFLSWLFTSGGHSIGASASASVLPMNIQGWYTLELTGLISLQSRGSQESSSTPPFKSINSSVLSFLHSPTLTYMSHTYSPTHPHMTTGKTIALNRQTFVGKVMSLLFKTLSRFVMEFLFWE